jgi:hypothetical protein
MGYSHVLVDCHLHQQKPMEVEHLLFAFRHNKVVTPMAVLRQEKYSPAEVVRSYLALNMM